jgi:hypothetical protein
MILDKVRAEHARIKAGIIDGSIKLKRITYD